MSEQKISSKSFKHYEYTTETRKEVEYLEAHGIKPSFTYKDKETGIRCWKYKKTTELFLALASYFLEKEHVAYRIDVVGGENNG